MLFAYMHCIYGFCVYTHLVYIMNESNSSKDLIDSLLYAAQHPVYDPLKLQREEAIELFGEFAYTRDDTINIINKNS